MPPTHISKLKSHLLSLPLEILDIILDYAYPEEAITTYVTREDWEDRESDRRRMNPGNYVSTPYTPKINDFIVSKAFYNIATRVWAANQHFKDHRFYSRPYTEPFCPNAFNCLTLQPSSIAFHHCRKLSIGYDGRFFDAYKLPSLKELVLEVGFRLFVCIEPTFVWDTPLSEKQLELVWSDSRFCRLRGLQHFALVAGKIQYASTTAQKQQWADNVSALEHYVRANMRERDENVEEREEAQDSLADAYEESSKPADVLVKLDPAVADRLSKIEQVLETLMQSHISTQSAAEEAQTLAVTTQSSPSGPSHRQRHQYHEIRHAAPILALLIVVLLLVRTPPES